MKKLSLLIFAFLLASCGGDVRETLGMKIDAPDEFSVERKPKLEVPPSFKLRPPAPGAAPLNVADKSETAKEVITGKSEETPIAASDQGERALLSKAGATSANPEIRSVLTSEYAGSADKNMLEKLRMAADKNSDKTLVDPVKEKERLEANQKNNKPITEGETPSKSENAGKSLFEKLFD